jgi:serine/threonine protein kinase
MKQFHADAVALHRLSHPNITPLVSATQVNPLSREIECCLIFPFLPLTLHQIMYVNMDLSCQRKIKVLLQVFQGLNYLHLRGINHGNLMPFNIQFDGRGRVKLANIYYPALDLMRYNHQGDIMFGYEAVYKV